MYPYEMFVHYAEASRFERRLASLSRRGLDPYRTIQGLGGKADPDYGYDSFYVPATSWVAPTGTYLELGAWASPNLDAVIIPDAGEPGVRWRVRSRRAVSPEHGPHAPTPPPDESSDRKDFGRFEEAIDHFYLRAVSHPGSAHALAVAPATSYEPRPYAFARGLPWSLVPYSFAMDFAPHVPTRFFRSDSHLRVSFADRLDEYVPLGGVANARLADDPGAGAGLSSATLLAGLGVGAVGSAIFGPAGFLAGGLVGIAHHSSRRSDPPALLALYADADGTHPAHAYPLPRKTKEAREFVGGLNSVS